MPVRPSYPVEGNQTLDEMVVLYFGNKFQRQMHCVWQQAHVLYYKCTLQVSQYMCPKKRKRWEVPPGKKKCFWFTVKKSTRSINFIAIIIIIITIAIVANYKGKKLKLNLIPLQVIVTRYLTKSRLSSSFISFSSVWSQCWLFFWPWNFYQKSNSPLAIACLFERVHQLHGVLRGEVTNAEDKIIELDPIMLPCREICIGL